jgi:pimeloyl-ACP methyl ester carboxylesterase
VLGVIAALRELPREYARRDEFTAALAARGFSTSLAGWLGKNLVRHGDRFRLALDLDAIEAILADFHRVDLWPEIAGARFAVHAVTGGRSDALGDAARERLAAGATAGEVRLHEIPDAGHWLHIDAPRALVEILVGELSGDG